MTDVRPTGAAWRSLAAGGALLLTPQGAGAVPAVQADLHLDTPSQVLLQDVGLDAPAGLGSGLARMRDGGTNLAVMVLWPGKPGVEHRARTLALLERMEAEVARLPDVVRVDTPAAARAAAAAGQVGVVYALEGAHGLGDDWRADLVALRARGLVLLGLTWSTSNRFAGSSGDGGGGLTAEGRALVAEARRLGILIDVSHASDATVADVCAADAGPLVASHSNARAVRDHARNLTDPQIRCIAASGGVVGLNLHAPFLGEGADTAAVVRHAAHLRDVGGPGVVALGSDFDGWITTPAGLPDAGALPTLWAALAADGWDAAGVRGVRGESFLRAWAAAAP